MYAGSLKYDTKLDSSGFKQGLSKLGTVAGKIGKGIATAMVTATATVGALVTQSVKAYGDYEQLIGGVDKLFQESSKRVQEYAKNSFRTAGISANEYLETVTGISANLIKSLGGDTKKASDIANMAIKDMADNANTFGTSMEDVKNVYSALARGMYVTLDNLKLGYAGTKQGAEQMIADANRIKEANGEMANLSVDNYADLVEAIHIAQEQLHITGTTAKEASTTLQGSLKMAKASWQDLVAGISNPDANISVLINNFIESAVTFGKNLIPIVEQALLGVGTLIEKLLPEIIERIPTIINSIFPQLINSGIDMVNSILKGIQQNLPAIINGAVMIILQLVNGLADMLPTLIPVMVDAVILIVETLIDNLDLIIDAGLQLIIALAFGIVDALPRLLEKLPTLISKMVIELTKPEMLQKLISAGILLIIALIEGIVKTIPTLLKTMPTIISSAKNQLKNNIKNTDWRQLGRDIIMGIKNGLINYAGELYNSLKNIASSALRKAKEALKIKSPSRVFADQVGQWIPKGIAVGIDANVDSALKSLDDMSDEMVDRMKDAVNIETGKSSFSGLSSTVNEMISANSEFTGDINNVLTLDGEVVYENQQKIEARKNLQYGGIK